jgi:hypothetical protein
VRRSDAAFIWQIGSFHGSIVFSAIVQSEVELANVQWFTMVHGHA